jgi:hypothetical protein
VIEVGTANPAGVAYPRKCILSARIAQVSREFAEMEEHRSEQNLGGVKLVVSTPRDLRVPGRSVSGPLF